MRNLPVLALALALPLLAQVGNLQLSKNSVEFSAPAAGSLPQSQIVGVTSTGAALPVSTSTRYFTAAEGWITTELSSGVTPSNLTITVNSSNLPVGVHTGQVLVVASASQSAWVTVSLTVTGGPTGSVLTASPNALAMTSNDGQPVQNTLVITSTNAVPFQTYTSTDSGGSWLSVSVVSATSPTTVTVTANPANLTPGVYSGMVSLVPTVSGTGLTVPVTFTISSSGSMGFAVSPGTVNFSYQSNGPTPGGQSVYVTNNSSIVTYSATANASWIKLTTNLIGNPAQTVTGSSNSYLNLYVDPTDLSTGNYSNTVTVTASTGAVQTINVLLSVNSTGALTASPTSLTFQYQPDFGVPASQQLTISASGLPVNFTASANSAGWLLVGPQSGNTSTAPNLSVSVMPVSLPNGSYTGTISVTTGSTTLSIPVTLHVGTSSGSAITPSPQSLTFHAPYNGPSTTQNVFLSSATTKSFFATVSTASGSWLQVSPTGGFSPATLSVTVNPQAVPGTGTYSGSVLINNLSDNTQVSIPVTMILSGAPLAATPQALSFTMPAGATTGATQIVQLSGTSGAPFTATSNSAWLTVSPANAALPYGLSVQAASASLTPGNYTGAVTITSSGVITVVNVALTVTAATVPTLSPTILNFGYVTGGSVPGAQTIAVNSTSSTALPFTTSVRSGSTGTSWLAVTASSLVTPASLSVAVQPGGLAPGTYRGVVVVTATGSGETRTAEVVLTVTAPTAPTLSTALHGATRKLSAITPGMLLSLRGAGLGPVQGVNGSISSAGAYETSYGTYRVYFDGVAAPLLYISDTRIDTAVPYAMAGRRSARVEVENAGVRSNPMDLILSPDAAPGIYTQDGSGVGQASVLNQNGSLNSLTNPAAAGSVISFFATGEGQTEPAGQDGRVIATDLRRPVLPVAVNIGGSAAEVIYAGSAPGLISGLMQVNVRIPADAPRGGAVALELRVGPAPSRAGVTIAIQ
ncbi:MAG TPA: hypothetical protein VFQ91_20260 [Bryobacteraceae bacterium]|nr:hypothetical protein [Bryobacteraceae bacterium]